MPTPDLTAAATTHPPPPAYDRWALWGGIALLVAASWGYLLYEGWAMQHMDIVDMAMPGVGPWTFDDFVLVFTMWAVMMVAMMLPTVVPMLLVYRRVLAAQRATAHPAALTGVFAAGYLMAWMLCSGVATLAHGALHGLAAISPAMTITFPVLGGVVLVAAGVYQWTPLKHACLERCRSPLSFLLNQWRSGPAGALAMGFQHGIYCAGCCWMLMAILFVVGVMNLLWVATLTALVLAEKALPHGQWLARGAGVAMIVWGGWLLGSAAR